MPKSSMQTRNEVIVKIKENQGTGSERTDLITKEELVLAMSKSGISAPCTVRGYTKTLLALNYLERTGEGFRLTKESINHAVIQITVSPTQNTSEVLRAVEKATQRFGDVVVLGLVL